MKYIGYDFDIRHECIILDEELNIDKFGWKHGDMFVVDNVNGKAMLRKLDPLVQFIREGELGATNGFSKISS